MDTLADTLRGTILSLKQIKDRLKQLTQALGDIPSGSTIYESIEEINETVYESAASIVDFLQGENSGATNTAILEAIGTIGLDMSELAKQGDDSGVTLTDVARTVNDLDLELDGVAQQGSGSPEDVNLTVVDDKIGDLDEIITAINGDTVDNIVNMYLDDEAEQIENIIGDWSNE